MMMTKIKYISFVFAVLIMAGCKEDAREELPPYNERKSAATSELVSELTSATNGWKAKYQPTGSSGEFLLLFKFNDNGTVNIKSDVSAGEGEFYDHTINYRVDNAMGLELVFETYGVMHFLFEIDQNTFGADFEFLYSKKVSENLIFYGKNSVPDSKLLILEPAGANDQNQLSREIDKNLREFGTVTNSQQLILQDLGISVFWELDDSKRTIEASIAGVGTTYDEVFQNGNIRIIDQTSGYRLENGKLILSTPLEFVVGNKFYTIETLSFGEFKRDQPNACTSNTALDAPRYTGQVASYGNFDLVSGYFNIRGADFVNLPYPYTVNVYFVFDDQGESLSETGLIHEYFPDATTLIFNYNADTANLNPPYNKFPPYGVGLLYGNQGIMRGFAPSQTVGTKVEVSLTDEYFHTGVLTEEDRLHLEEITDKIFEGGKMYAFDYPDEDLGFRVFVLYNPCNEYVAYLVN